MARQQQSTALWRAVCGLVISCVVLAVLALYLRCWRDAQNRKDYLSRAALTIHSRNPDRTLSDPPVAARGLAFSPNGKRLVCGGYEGLALLEVSNGRVVWFLESERASCDSVAFAPDGRWIVTACGGVPLGRAAAAWDARTGTLNRVLEGWGAASFDPAGKYLAVGGKGGPLLYRLPEWRPVRKLGEADGSLVRYVTFARSASILAAILSPGDRVLVWNAETGKLLGDTHPRQPVQAAALSPDGHVLALALGRDPETNSVIELWEATKVSHSWRRIAVLDPCSLTVGGMSFSPDGALLAVGGVQWRPYSVFGDWKPRPWGGAVRTWSVRTLDQTWEWCSLQLRDAVGALAFTPDGKMLVCASRAGRPIRMWSVRE